MRPARKRELVATITERHAISTRRACKLVMLQRSTYYSIPRMNPMNEILRRRLKELAMNRPRYGYRRLHVLLQREGWQVNKKRVLRLYKAENLALRTKKRKKRAKVMRVVPAMPSQKNQRWGIDFMSDALRCGRRIRIFNVIDLYARECIGSVASTSFPAQRVTEILNRIAAKRDAYPDIITCDNGTEFTSKCFDAWAYDNQVEIDFIGPGRPFENGIVERFNGSMRDECLNMHQFATLDHAQALLNNWVLEYNETRPHSRLDNFAPAEYVRRLERHAA